MHWSSGNWPITRVIYVFIICWAFVSIARHCAYPVMKLATEIEHDHILPGTLPEPQKAKKR